MPVDLIIELYDLKARKFGITSHKNFRENVRDFAVKIGCISTVIHYTGILSREPIDLYEHNE